MNAALGELYARVEAGGGVTLQDYEDVSRAVGTLTLEAPGGLHFIGKDGIAWWPRASCSEGEGVYFARQGQRTGNFPLPPQCPSPLAACVPVIQSTSQWPAPARAGSFPRRRAVHCHAPPLSP